MKYHNWTMGGVSEDGKPAFFCSDCGLIVGNPPICKKCGVIDCDHSNEIMRNCKCKIPQLSCRVK